jgi:hypothetical protein
LDIFVSNDDKNSDEINNLITITGSKVFSSKININETRQVTPVFENTEFFIGEYMNVSDFLKYYKDNYNFDISIKKH